MMFCTFQPIVDMSRLKRKTIKQRVFELSTSTLRSFDKGIDYTDFPLINIFAINIGVNFTLCNGLICGEKVLNLQMPPTKNSLS